MDATVKIYLGDTVYFNIDLDGELALTMGDGLSTTNRIVLEPFVLVALLRSLSSHYCTTDFSELIKRVDRG